MITNLSASDRLLIPHDFWISSERQMTIIYSMFRDQYCPWEITPCPRIEPPMHGLITNPLLWCTPYCANLAGPLFRANLAGPLFRANLAGPLFQANLAGPLFQVCIYTCFFIIKLFLLSNQSTAKQFYNLIKSLNYRFYNSIKI